MPFFAMTDAELRRARRRRVLAAPEKATVAAALPHQPAGRRAGRDLDPAALRAPHLPDVAVSRQRADLRARGRDEAASFINHVPAQQRTRLLSVRAYDDARHHGGCRVWHQARSWRR